ncbi:MAG: hypothetical protein ACRCSB_05105 [Bacteroidales bacterium]
MDLDIGVRQKCLTPTNELRQADIFEHLFTLPSAFDLQAFQAKYVT